MLFLPLRYWNQKVNNISDWGGGDGVGRKESNSSLLIRINSDRQNTRTEMHIYV